MRILLLFCISFSLSFLSVLPSYAQDQEEMSVVSFRNALGELNRLKPLQNPKYKRAKEILARHVIDSHSKVVGEVQDVLISKKDGAVSSLSVSFDRLRLGHAVFLNYQALDIKGVSNGYRLNFEDDSIIDLYPELLANIETAAGQSDIVSLSSLLYHPLTTSKGHKIGEITDILFDELGAEVESVYLNVNYKYIRNKGLAIPLAVLEFKQQGSHIKMMIDQAFVDSILQYVKG